MVVLILAHLYTLYFMVFLTPCMTHLIHLPAPSTPPFFWPFFALSMTVLLLPASLPTTLHHIHSFPIPSTSCIIHSIPLSCLPLLPFPHSHFRIFNPFMDAFFMLCVFHSIYKMYISLAAWMVYFLDRFFGSNNYKLPRKGSVFPFTVGRRPQKASKNPWTPLDTCPTFPI